MFVLGLLVINLGILKKNEPTLISKASAITQTPLLNIQSFEVEPNIINVEFINSNTSYLKTPQAYQGDILTADGPLSQIAYIKDNVINYEVQEGDTILAVAELFNISEDSIRWANDLDYDELYKGKIITVPPVTGVLHTIQTDESIEFLAHLYDVPVEAIYNVNRVAYDGVKIVIPNARPVPHYKEPTGYKGIQTQEYFIRPVRGFNWGRLHNNNAVDIAAVCETPVVAASDGVVVKEKHDGFNSGYGNYIIIEHMNGTKTLYAHNTENIVSVGDIVYQGEVIATLGNTGNVYGITGCHLHFEVQGAENPFVVK